MSEYEVISTGQGIIKAWIKGVPVEEKAIEQLYNIARLPFIYKWVAAMPDVHWGIGATVGTVLPTLGAVIPAAVGVDIGCGMMAMQTTLTRNDLPLSLWTIRKEIETLVPMGRGPNKNPNSVGAWVYRNEPENVVQVWREQLQPEFHVIAEKFPQLAKANTVQHLGTLGTGNHFIEVCLDTENNVWTLLHSGSRGVGNQIGSMFIKLAQAEMQKWHISLPDKDLAYLPEGTEIFDWYIRSVTWAQKFAWYNRQLMMENVIKALKNTVDKSFEIVKEINSHHNYVAKEYHFGKNILVTRKGAVRARQDDWGIIPGSMGAKSFIVRGKGNPDSFTSCSHGAGRAMGRREAERRFTVEDHVKATEGVECLKDASVLDETPAAYKPIDSVMAAQTDLVDIVHTLKQVVCAKGVTL